MNLSASKSRSTLQGCAAAPRENLVVANDLRGGSALPLVMKPHSSSISLHGFLDWITSNREFIETQVLKHGALLFRGFPITCVNDFQTVAASLSDELLDYTERSSPRSKVIEKVYTSTDYPPSQAIFPHNEHSYALTYPRKLFFCCLKPPRTGGETPLIPIRKVTGKISEMTQNRFKQMQWMYVRNFGDGLGLSWQTAFQTSDRSVVEEYCRKAQIETEWKDRERLRTRQIRPAFIKHPITGEDLWFNHVTFFNIAVLDKTMQEVLTEEFSEQDLPNNTYYGDGSRIETSVIDELRAAYLSEMVVFPWEMGDIVLLDNVLAAHARSSYTPPRQVVVCMADPVTRTDIF
jgi:alpha-ketoglutarate-dependent taurine dioxygenase